jgi:hypothetical protein
MHEKMVYKDLQGYVGYPVVINYIFGDLPHYYIPLGQRSKLNGSTDRPIQQRTAEILSDQFQINRRTKSHEYA